MKPLNQVSIGFLLIQFIFQNIQPPFYKKMQIILRIYLKIHFIVMHKMIF